MALSTIEQAVAAARELDLSIDENDLFGEWQGQGALMLEYGILLADAYEEEDEAKVALGCVVTELDKEIRNDPEAFGLAKATESMVINAIPGQPEHVEAMKKVNKCKHHVRVLRAVMDSLEHRRSSLKGMTEVFNRQWYADPESSGQPQLPRAAAKRDSGAVDMTGPPTKTIEGRRPRRPKRS